MRCEFASFESSQPVGRLFNLLSIRLVIAVLISAPAVLGCGDEAGKAPATDTPGPKPIHVEVIEVKPQEFVQQVSLTGQLDAEFSVELMPEDEGVVESILAVEGDSVQKGEVLFRMRDGLQKASVREARAELALAQDVFERTRDLSRKDISSQAQRAEAKAGLEIARAKLERAEVELGHTVIRAPFDGVLGSLQVSPGARMHERDGFITLSAIDRLQVSFTLQEMGVPIARVGAPIEVRVIAFPGEKFPGEVFYVAPSIDPSTRRLILKAWVPNPDHRLKPGMFANVDVEVSRRQGVLLLPESAMVYDRHGVYVWRVDEGGNAEKVPVKLGLREQGVIEVVKGVEPGDRVITAGTNKVLAGRKLAFDRGATAKSKTVQASEPAHEVSEDEVGAES